MRPAFQPPGRRPASPTSPAHSGLRAKPCALPRPVPDPDHHSASVRGIRQKLPRQCLTKPDQTGSSGSGYLRSPPQSGWIWTPLLRPVSGSQLSRRSFPLRFPPSVQPPRAPQVDGVPASGFYPAPARHLTSPAVQPLFYQPREGPEAPQHRPLSERRSVPARRL